MKKQPHEYRTRQMPPLIQPLQFHSSPKGDENQLQAASLMSALVPTHQDTQVHVWPFSILSGQENHAHGKSLQKSLTKQVKLPHLPIFSN